jgi:hypothetical protein
MNETKAYVPNAKKIDAKLSQTGENTNHQKCKNMEILGHTLAK